MGDTYATRYRAERARQVEAWREQRQRHWAVWSKSKGRCWYCGSQCRLRTRTVRLQFYMSHLVPLSRGGTDDLTNLVPSCRPCSTRKGTRTLEEFRASETRRRLEHLVTKARAAAQGLQIPLLAPGPWTLPVRFWGEKEGSLWPS